MRQQGRLTEVNQYEGKFELLAPSGSVTEQGACRVGFDDEKLTLVPETGTTLVVDLGDLDTLSAADYELRARLYSGETVRLRQFGRSYEELAKTLVECYRGRTLNACCSRTWRKTTVSKRDSH